MPQVFYIVQQPFILVPNSIPQDGGTRQEKQGKPTKQANKIWQAICKVSHKENKGNL